MSIQGKVALVTGAGQGIGRAIALRLASDGGDIAIVDVNPGKMESVAEEIRHLGRKATAFKADVTKRDAAAIWNPGRYHTGRPSREICTTQANRHTEHE